MASILRVSNIESPDSTTINVDDDVLLTGNLSIDGSLTLLQGDQNWHEVGAVGEPAFQNSWANYDSTYNTAAFKKDSAGNVWIKGLIASGTIGQVVFTLPVAYRPSKIILTVTMSSSGAGRLDIHSNGTVIASSGASAWYSIERGFHRGQ